MRDDPGVVSGTPCRAHTPPEPPAAADDRGIDVVRNKIKMFATKKGERVAKGSERQRKRRQPRWTRAGGACHVEYDSVFTRACSDAAARQAQDHYSRRGRLDDEGRAAGAPCPPPPQRVYVAGSWKEALSHAAPPPPVHCLRRRLCDERWNCTAQRHASRSRATTARR